jgi:serine/threonine protein phosphatase PrpC
MKFSVFQISRKGGRERNEDRMGYCYTRESGLFVLADGMGGHPEGEVAAQLALQTISALYQKEARPIVKDVTEFLSSSLMAAHHQIIRYASEKGMLDTPRTTLVAAIVQGTSATWVHCGDSRLYVVRDGELLTKPVFDVTGPVTLQQGDKILLCSDGLWGTLADADIVRQLSTQSVSDAVPDLVEMALRNGGEHCDNVTVIALEWETPDSFESTRGISTDSISDGVFASTIQAGVLDTVVEDLDDAAIERSIAEINEAIRRSAARKG